MSKLIIIRGNSASGKSTVAEKLRSKMGAGTMLIPQDTVRREILRVQDQSSNPSIKLIYDIAMYGKGIGYDVIVEGILGNDKYGDMLRKLIKEFSGECHVYYFAISFEETVKRHNSKSTKDEYGEKELRSWWADKDYLGVNGERMITDTMTENQIVELIYQDISN